MFSAIACIRDDHDWRLIVVAAVVCLAGSVATMLLLERARRSAGSQRHLWIAVCAFACGVGVWSTHFIAMLAYDGGIPIAYGVGGTSFSIAVAIAASWVAFSVGLAGTSRHAPAVGGLLLGLGIAAMHVSGMRAIEVQGRVAFDPETSFAAVLLGTLIAGLALHSFQVLRGVRGLAASILLLVAAICVLHVDERRRPDPRPERRGNARLRSVLAGGRRHRRIDHAHSHGFGALFVDRHLTDLKGLANASLEGMVILRGGEVIEVNERFATLSGRKPAELVGRQRRELFAEAPERRSSNDLGAGEGASEGELLHADGGYVPVERLCRTIEYKGRQCDVIFVRDLTARKDAERTIEHLAHHDALTDLSNRSSFDRRLRQALAAAVHHDDALAVLCLDLDRFKAVNDIFGHGEGDRILRKVADILRAAAGEADTIARLGGDEFAIVQTGAAQPEAARLLADRILKLFSEEMDTRRDPMAVGVSIGVAICPGDGTTAERLYGNADTALYRAKQTGKGIACFFDAEMDAAVRTRRQIENDLRHAVVRRQLFLEYQPLVDVRDDRIVGYEALLRWRHPDRGLVGPNLFIPIAEESGSIIQIGEWVLEEACSEAVRWHEPLPVSVNVSPVQFLLPNLFDRIESILMRTGRRLELEITEAALMHNRDDVLATLVRLRLLGVRIVMDDFGTGHSSLSNLQTFPFDKLKIDCSFTASLDKDPAAHAIIRAIIALGHSLNLPVVTEGVETERQRQIIVDEGCRQIQGFLTGRPGLAPSVDAASSSSTMPHRVGA
ncbi:EAL domain-containing protein [Sinorhizobium meliloti]|nr:EAL domain-containing protein [Sinorhizobium meliloti]RVH94758.1 EAL domain-containing protein [Sinorhizobium meliloti]RVK26945.1 EAL domain-containing protein [Sinorhizobium meliloti]RVK81298.1 EAL domain-containing protein [Sinorhizobium meliloti]RVL14317.1 EAL domain-containing protein [Sinorhizobium meliloti]